MRREDQTSEAPTPTGPPAAPRRRVLVHHPDGPRRHLLVSSLGGARLDAVAVADLEDLERRLGNEPIHAIVLAAVADEDAAALAFFDRLRVRPDGTRHLGVAFILARALDTAERARLHSGRARVLLEPVRLSELRLAVHELTEPSA